MTPSPDAVDQSESIRSDVETGTSIVYSCLRCGHHWTPKDQSRPPRCCSLCRSAYWDSPLGGDMSADDRAVAQARIREKVAQRAALARRKTAERKLVRWAGEVGRDAIGIVGALYPTITDTINEIADSVELHPAILAAIKPSSMPPPPKFEDER